VLSLSFITLSGFLSSQDGLLLLLKHLYFLMDPDQLTLISFGFLFCFIPILDFNLVELGFTLVDLQWWWKRVGVEVLVALITLTGNSCGGGLGGLL
jgi:hypothetical protein